MDFVRVWIDASPTTGNKELFRIKLPLEELGGSICELYKTLKIAVDIQIAGTGTKQEKGGYWKYQLLSRDLKTVVNKKSVYLMTDDDYCALIKTIKGDGKGTPVAVLTQEKMQAVDASADSSQIDVNEASKQTESNDKRPENDVDDDAFWDESNWKEPLDEDGNPYFDPYDSDQFTRVAIKYAEEHKGLIDEGL